MTTSLLKGRRFYCREWAFGKVQHCLDNRASAKTCGALVMGGPGCGKTAFCCELIWPSSSHGRQVILSKRSLAHYFCQAHDIETLSITNFIHCLVDQISKSNLIQGYDERLQDHAVQVCLETNQCEQKPDEAFLKGVLGPLGEIPAPNQNLFILVDSIDESCLASGYGGERSSGSRTIAELLARNHQLFPPWLLLVCSARKQSKSVTRLFTGFRKISLDDLRKSQVVRDVQQYILCRLDQEDELRQHLSRETAEMLNQLHIKSNGCFLYLKRVLDGVAANFILLREIRDIPGTLNGLFLWLCQRLFVRKQFSKVQPILNVILAARRPLTEMELYSCAYTRNVALTYEEFRKRMELLSKILIEGKDGTKILFHHSFAEWLLDVKHCTQKYLCKAADGHGMLAMSFTMHAPSLTPVEIQDFALHLGKSNLLSPITHCHLALWMIQSGANVTESLALGLPRDQNVLKLLLSAGATLPLASESCLKGLVSSAAATGLRSVIRDGDDDNDDDVDELSEILDRAAAVNDMDSNGRSQLCNAAHQGDLEAVRKLIAKGADVEAVDKTGQTALNLASRQGHAQVVGILLESSAEINHTDGDGWTALRSAAWGGHTQVVKTLLSANADVDHADSDQRTALRAAAWGGHDEIVVLLLKSGAEVNKADHEGRTALIAAAYMGHVDIVRHLLNHGADINHEDIDGRTALSVAALCMPANEGHLNVVSLLLERNAEVDHCDHDGMTPLLVAAYEGHRAVCELLLESDADVDHSDQNNRTPLQAAASMGHSHVVNLLLFWGAAVDTIDSEGRTVLCIAAQQGNVDVVRQLLDRGLDEMHRDNAGWTPLHMAGYEGHKQVVEALVEAGARVTEVDNEGRIPLILSAQEGHLGAVSALLHAGSPIDARPHDGKTPLRVAALEGHHDVVHFFICQGADLNYQDVDGRTTLYVLALENHVSIAKLLLENTARTELSDLEGRSPLHVAAWQGHYQMADTLLQNGANPNAVDNDQRTALQSAAWQGHANIVRLLLDCGARVDHTCNQGATALCIAAQEGHENVVKVLLQFKANPNHADQYGRTATRVALKGGHKKVVKILEDHGAQGGNGRNSSSNNASIPANMAAAAAAAGPLKAPVSHAPSAHKSSRASSAAAAASQALVSAMAIANGHVNGTPSESPNSTGDRHKSNMSIHSKSSSNVNTASTNRSVGSADCGSGALTFTQQLQQCSLGKNRKLNTTKALSPVSEPGSPCSAPTSPISEIMGGKPSPEVLSHSCQGMTKTVSPRCDGPPAMSSSSSIRIISNPTSHNDVDDDDEDDDEPVWQKQSDVSGSNSSVNMAKLELTRKGSLPPDTNPNSSQMPGITMGQAALGLKSPESRRKRNGIVTNPNYSLTKSLNINGYYNKLSETIDFPPTASNGSPSPVTPSTSAPSLSSSKSKTKATRPNGLPLKKETPL